MIPSQPGPLLAYVRARDVVLTVDGDRLRYGAPAGIVTPELRAALIEHKPALLALLRDLEELERDGTAEKLRALAATLTPEEHHRLATEAAGGDRLAQLVVAALGSPPRTEAL